MKYLRLILGVFIGLMAITIIAESIEFYTVKFVSQKSAEYLTSESSANEYFAVRNQVLILIFKFFYSLLGAFIGGYLCAWISGSMARMGIYILILVQIAAIVWAGFISELGASGPVWMWIYLLVILPLGIWWGYKARLTI